MAPRRPAQGIRQEAEPEALFRVFRSADGLPAYLPTGRGLPREEAERLSRVLAVDTEVREVWRREGDA